MTTRTELVDPVGFARARALVEAVEVLLGPRVGVDLLAHRGEIAHLCALPPRRRKVTRRRPRELVDHARSRDSWRPRCSEPGERAPARAVGEIELDLHQRACPRADRVDGHPDLHPVAARERQHVAESSRGRAPAGRRSARACAGRSAGGSPSGRSPGRAPSPPPTRRAKTATARSAVAARATASTSGPSSRAESPRSPSQSRNTTGLGARRSPAAPRRSAGARGGAHRAALADHAARCAPPARPCSRAISRGGVARSRRRRPTPPRPGSARASAASVAAMRSRLVAGGDEHRRRAGPADRSAALSIVPVLWLAIGGRRSDD